MGHGKARLLESNRAWGTAHGSERIYLLERPFDRAFLAPPLRPRDLEAPARRAEGLRAAAFRAPAFLPFAFSAFFAFRAPEDFRAADFFLPDDREELFAAFFFAPPLEALPPERALGADPLALDPAAVPFPLEVDPNDVRLALDAPPPNPLAGALDGLPKLEPAAPLPPVPPAPLPKPPPVSVDS